MALKVKVDAKYVGKTVAIACAYEQDEGVIMKQGNQYRSTFEFDLFKQGERKWMWVHQDECLFHGYSDARAYSMPIMPVRNGETIEIAVSLMSLQGAMK